jgi:hypothetical protein
MPKTEPLPPSPPRPKPARPPSGRGTEEVSLAEPTAERRQHAVYVEQDIGDVLGKGRVTIGKAFRKQPRFESIGGLGMDQLRVLRVYRAAFDATELSEVKSALDIRLGVLTARSPRSRSRRSGPRP